MTQNDKDEAEKARRAADRAKRVAREISSATREVDSVIRRYVEARKRAEAATSVLLEVSRELDALDRSLSRHPILRYSGLSALLGLRKAARSSLVASRSVSGVTSPTDTVRARDESLARALLSIEADIVGFE